MEISSFKQRDNGLYQGNNNSTVKNTFSILSVDGGGIKGLYPARILQLIEEQYDIKVADQFDMICGTSTGGLISLALSIKKPASEIVSLYQNKGSVISPEPKNKIQKRIQKLRQLTFGGKYKNNEFKKIL